MVTKFDAIWVHTQATSKGSPGIQITCNKSFSYSVWLGGGKGQHWLCHDILTCPLMVHCILPLPLEPKCQETSWSGFHGRAKTKGPGPTSPIWCYAWKDIQFLEPSRTAHTRVTPHWIQIWLLSLESSCEGENGCTSLKEKQALHRACWLLSMTAQRSP